MSEEIAALPKVELHLHLEGSLRPATMFALAARHGIGLGAGSAEELTGQYRFESFDDFLRLFLTGLEVMKTGDDFADVTVALASDLASQNVRYAELTSTAYSHFVGGMPPRSTATG